MGRKLEEIREHEIRGRGIKGTHKACFVSVKILTQAHMMIRNEHPQSFLEVGTPAFG